ncbi:zinc finger protein 189-like isoform X2 [Pectinophora gossypiella]|uniref:C2H2-type domain-containing protein n=1 Tax=Pectinophora gossypiella TaxID=13191 RepID=A0A1E1WE58_PECGO|nr:zinc finger protein 189-like isoform X2 [Pectinophora gossypiella]
MDPLEGSSKLSEMLKVEIEVKEETDDFFDNSLLFPTDLIFDDTEVMSDPTSGLMVCLLCWEEMEPNGVAEHMVKIHKYRKIVYKCWNCDTIFYEREGLVQHRETCHPKKPVKKTMRQIIAEAYRTNASMCPICLIQLDNNLKEHIEAEHNKPPVIVPCTVCQKPFKSKMTMTQHRKYVHESVQDSSECNMCGQKFASVKYLANHVRNVHPTGDKVHKCQTCGKDFKSHQSLYQHNKNVHLGYYAKKLERRLERLNQSD